MKGIVVEALNEGLKSINVPLLKLDCKCLNGAICRQRVNLDSERILMISTDFNSFVAPSHTHDTYCACNFGYTGIYKIIIHMYIRRYNIYH